MIIFSFILILVLSLLADRYIYIEFIKPRSRRALNIAFFVVTILVYLSLVVSILVIRYIASPEDHTVFMVGMWLIFLFFLLTIPKSLFVITSLPDLFVRAIKGRQINIFSWIGAVVAAVTFCMIVWGGTIGRTTIRVERLTLESGRLPKSFDGLRIVQFSDTHIGTMVNSEKLLNRMVDSINSLNPDIVVQSGDIVNLYHTELTEPIKKILSRIKARYGVYAVYGNHDLGFYVRKKDGYQENIDIIKEVQQSMGWTFLNNETAYLKVGQDSISISGLNFPTTVGHNGYNSNMGGVDFDKTYCDLPKSIYNISISHAPQLWERIMEMGRGDLVLSGHVHSMQSKIVVGNWQWSPAQYMYKEWSGLYERSGSYLYINDGIGCVIYPMRVGASSPEVTLIELRSKK